MDDRDQELNDALPAYVLGALDAAEERELRAWLETLPDGEQRLAGWRAVTEQLAASPPPVVPSEITRQRLLRRIGRGAPHGRRSAAGWVAAAALAAVALGLGAATLHLRGEAAALATARDRAAAEAERAARQLAAARGERDALAAELHTLAGAGARITQLAGLGSAGAAAGRAFVDPETRTARFYAYRLPPLPADRSYQLWFIADGRPVSAGVFTVDREGRASVEVDEVAPPERIDAWAVTVEPRGGRPQPTGEMVLRG